MISENEVFSKIIRTMRDRSVSSDSEFEEIMEEVIDQYQDIDLITDDDNVELMRDDLFRRWEDFKDKQNN